jgi:hypothetical protein
MPKSCEALRVSGFAQREQDNLASLLSHRFGNGKRQAATAANDRQWALVGSCSWCRYHVSIAASPRLTAMVSGRFPS